MPGRVGGDALERPDAAVLGRDAGKAGVDDLDGGTPTGPHRGPDLDGGRAGDGCAGHAGDGRPGDRVAHRAITLRPAAPRRSDQPVVQRVECRGTAGGDTDLGEDVFQVRVDGLRRYAE